MVKLFPPLMDMAGRFTETNMISNCSSSRRGRVRRLSLATAVWGLLLPIAGAGAQEARTERDVVYRQGGGPDQTLDLYVPTEDGFPTIIFVHGGSLRSGSTRSSEEYARVCEPFVDAGIGCATIDYRVAPDHPWPAMPEDVAAAVRWVRDNISYRRGDPARLFLFGHSSGCHLAAAVGMNSKYLESVGLGPSDLAGIVPLGCILAPLDPLIRRAQAQGFGLDSVRARWNARPDDRFASFGDRLDSDPSRFVGSQAPPTLIVVAAEERFRPPILEQAAHFVDLMYNARRPADIVIVSGSHRSSIADIVNPGDPTFNAILQFMENPGAAGVGSRPSSIR